MSGRGELEPARRMHLRHRVQRATGRMVAVLWVPLAAVLLRLGFGYRVVEMKKVRREFRRLRRESDSQLLFCANQLTLMDSCLIAWALAPNWG